MSPTARSATGTGFGRPPPLGLPMATSDLNDSVTTATTTITHAHLFDIRLLLFARARTSPALLTTAPEPVDRFEQIARICACGYPLDGPTGYGGGAGSEQFQCSPA